MRFHLSFSLFFLLSLGLKAAYWQQAVEYTMSVDFDHTRHQFSGWQRLVLTNNSPDTLREVFYHLYFNSFQPGSHMDVRSTHVADPDERIGTRIAALDSTQIGYQRVKNISQNGCELKYTIAGTRLMATLCEPLLPGQKTVLEMRFKAQVPVQIRRNGRVNAEGVDYTMTQWYPKLAAYDRHGWHHDPYVSREFYGPFGSFDVRIAIDSSFVLAGTGTLQNADSIGRGYASTSVLTAKPVWHFRADKVHDFAWAADPDFVHTTTRSRGGVLIRFFHLPSDEITPNWTALMPKTSEMFDIMAARFGAYPYAEFSVIQGGDGGMEYPMCTMISGNGSFGGLLSVTVHEAIHNWYYGVIATNELLHPWMDEGFTTYAQNIVLDSLAKRCSPNPQRRNTTNAANWAASGNDEPLTTHADHYATNRAYGVASYSKGCALLSQLEYMVGEQTMTRIMHRYFNAWKFRHPEPADFARVAEQVSGIPLGWFFNQWVGTAFALDYRITNLEKTDSGTTLTLANDGRAVMPLHIAVKTKEGTEHLFIPNGDLWPAQLPVGPEVTVLSPWMWPSPTYSAVLPIKNRHIKYVEIDPTHRLPDAVRTNNLLIVE